jgi:hypothetical protein
MATTTTTTTTVDANVRPGRTLAQNYPNDYKVYESNVIASNYTGSSEQTQIQTPRLPHRNPPNWPNNHRRIPPHRPINRNLDQSQRRVYTSLGERVFLTMMFTGLEVNVVSGFLFSLLERLRVNPD